MILFNDQFHKIHLEYGVQYASEMFSEDSGHRFVSS